MRYPLSIGIIHFLTRPRIYIIEGSMTNTVNTTPYLISTLNKLQCMTQTCLEEIKVTLGVSPQFFPFESEY